MREIAVFGGGAHPALTAEICAHLAVPRRPVRLKRFANDCLEVQLQANCRERDVFIIQPLVPSVQEHLAVAGHRDPQPRHVAAALDPIGGLLGVREFPATTASPAVCARITGLGASAAWPCPGRRDP